MRAAMRTSKTAIESKTRRKENMVISTPTAAQATEDYGWRIDQF
jgi:hypothetical protein